MKSDIRAIAIALIAIVSSGMTACAEDRVRDPVDKALKTFETQFQKYAEQCEVWFDIQKSKSRNATTFATIGDLEIARNEFRTSGRLPNSATIRMRPTIVREFDDVIRAFNEAAQKYSSAGLKPMEAKLLEERDQFIKTSKVYWIPKNVSENIRCIKKLRAIYVENFPGFGVVLDSIRQAADDGHSIHYVDAMKKAWEMLSADNRKDSTVGRKDFQAVLKAIQADKEDLSDLPLSGGIGLPDVRYAK